MRYSLTTSKQGQTVIKIHHDFGDFNFYLMPLPAGEQGLFAWASDPVIRDQAIGQKIAMEAAKAIAFFAKRDPSTMTFEDMKRALQEAENIAKPVNPSHN